MMLETIPEEKTTNDMNDGLTRIHTRNQSQSDIKERRLWRSLCIHLDPDAVQFAAKFALTLFILIFCFYQVAWSVNACNNGAVWTIIGSVIGAWFEAPKLRNRTDNATSTAFSSSS
jgi:hypothetical protein